MRILRVFRRPAATIDDKIDETYGRTIRKRLRVHGIDHAAYRFVDLFNAVEAFAQERPKCDKIESDQRAELLNQLVHFQRPRFLTRAIGSATKIGWQSGPRDQVFLPVDSFWLCRSRAADDCILIRLSFHEMAQISKLEVACPSDGGGQRVVTQIVERARRNSIYRNCDLKLAYEGAKKDEYGDVEKQERLQVLFSAVEPVTAEDIVLSDEHLTVLQRNVIDIHARREILKANGVPTRRGVLLHGPPGTGKTFACRYVSHKLEGVTRIHVTGTSLGNVSAIFSLARLLQPSVLFLEDVDLVFTAREIGPYAPVLGDLLDHLDGLRANEDISVVLTTNAIDRIEAAIKDRPGRISQVLYMGPPNETLRRRYLEHHLRNRDREDLDLDQLVRDSEGGTQAFLKEWVHRAVQITCERLSDAREKARVRTSDFEMALAEMRQFLEGADGRIIGFFAPGRRP